MCCHDISRHECLGRKGPCWCHFVAWLVLFLVLSLALWFQPGPFLCCWSFLRPLPWLLLGGLSGLVALASFSCSSDPKARWVPSGYPTQPPSRLLAWVRLLSLFLVLLLRPSPLPVLSFLGLCVRLNSPSLPLLNFLVGRALFVPISPWVSRLWLPFVPPVPTFLKTALQSFPKTVCSLPPALCLIPWFLSLRFVHCGLIVLGFGIRSQWSVTWNSCSRQRSR